MTIGQQKHYLETELEDLLKSDPEIWRFLREGSLDGVWYWDLTDPEQEYMSPEFWRLFGFDPSTKKHLASEWQDLIFPEDLELAKENLAKHLADPDQPYDQIVRYWCVNGDVVWVRCRGLAIRDHKGNAIRLLGAHNDLSKLKRQQQEALETNAILTSVLNTTQSGIVGLSSSGEIVSINPAARHMLGGLSDDTPCAWPSNIRLIDRDKLHELEPNANPIARALTGVTLRGEIYSLTRTGQREARYVRVSTDPVEGVSGKLHTVVMLDDISEQEKNRQQVERTSRLDALGQLTGGIAHDFNNLLATVQYALTLAETASDDSRRRSYISTAKASIDRGSELTKRLLAFAKQQPGLAKSNNMQQVLDEFRKLAAPLIEASIKVTFTEKAGDLWVFCDSAQLINALLNILLNARDAILRSGTGSQITVLVRGIDEIEADATLRREDPYSYVTKGLIDEQARAQSPSKEMSYRYVELAIADDGPGMSDEVKRRAVDPFFTTKDTNSGTGLGLSMVYGFVQQSDGELRLYSEPDQGTTVRMLLPRGTPSGGREAPVDRATPSQGGGETILIVEDELGLMIVMQELINSLGYETETVRTAKDALELLDEGSSFDLVITDVVMPGGMSGFKLASEIRKRKPALPLLYMSGYTGYSEDDMEGVVAPMLQKPCPPNELADAIRLALGSMQS